MDGTPAALRPIAEQVLSWVAHRRSVEDKEAEELRRAGRTVGMLVEPVIRNRQDELRRIELCAQAVIEMSMFLDLYDLPR